VEGVNVANPPPISEGKLPFAQVFGLSDPQMHLQQVSFLLCHSSAKPSSLVASWGCGDLCKLLVASVEDIVLFIGQKAIIAAIHQVHALGVLEDVSL
jgi:hypothetical protein